MKPLRELSPLDKEFPISAPFSSKWPSNDKSSGCCFYYPFHTVTSEWMRRGTEKHKPEEGGSFHSGLIPLAETLKLFASEPTHSNKLRMPSSPAKFFRSDQVPYRVIKTTDFQKTVWLHWIHILSFKWGLVLITVDCEGLELQFH